MVKELSTWMNPLGGFFAGRATRILEKTIPVADEASFLRINRWFCFSNLGPANLMKANDFGHGKDRTTSQYPAPPSTAAVLDAD